MSSVLLTPSPYWCPYWPYTGLMKIRTLVDCHHSTREREREEERERERDREREKERDREGECSGTL
jgi:hypothetical protein